jgi:hypothetical protein
MAKKLTQQTLEKMVLETMNESKEVNEVFGIFSKAFKDQGKPASTPFGRKPTLPKSGKAENDATQLLRMIASDPKVPSSVKAQISDFLSYEPSTPEMKTDTSWDEEELPSANVMALGSKEDEPTTKLPSRTPTAKGTGFGRGDEESTPKMAGGIPTTKMNSPLRKKVAESKLEALVAEVLKEMSKKQPAKEPKKPVKK